jgi:hypothetical protein
MAELPAEKKTYKSVWNAYTKYIKVERNKNRIATGPLYITRQAVDM